MYYSYDTIKNKVYDTVKSAKTLSSSTSISRYDW